jgi:hypothetical protein
MSPSLDRLQNTLPPLPPTFDPKVLWFMHITSSYWLKYKNHISHVEEHHLERMVRIHHLADQGKVRCLYAFRHPTTDDHFSLLHLFAKSLPAQARRMGIPLQSPAHAFFVYDRGIPLWAGGIVNWLFPRVGGIPVYRGKADRQGMKAMREHLLNGNFPLAIAPEGGTNGQSEAVANLEPGVVQLGFWTAEDLQKAGRGESVVILPIGIQYEYPSQSWGPIDRLLLALERDCGIDKPPPTPNDRYQRLYDLGIFLLDWVANHYQKFYPAYAQAIDPHANLPQRLETVIAMILAKAEAHFQITGKGTTVDRCRRIEQATWDQIFRVEDIRKISALEKGFGDQLAREASASLWHMRIAESILPITGDYVGQHPSPSRFAEMLLLIWRVMARVQCLPFGKTPYLGQRKLILSAGEPIAISPHLPTYQANRHNAKDLVQKLTNELHSALRSLIRPSPM